MTLAWHKYVGTVFALKNTVYGYSAKKTTHTGQQLSRPLQAQLG